MYRKLTLIISICTGFVPIHSESTLHEELHKTMYNFKRAVSHIADVTLASCIVGGLCQALYHYLSNNGQPKKCNEGVTSLIGCAGLLLIKKNWNPQKEVYQQNRWFNLGLAQLLTAWGWELQQPIQFNSFDNSFESGFLPIT